MFFGLMSVAFDVAARRQYRVPRPWLGAVRRDVGPALYALVLIPFGVYLASYSLWFASETAIDRYEVGRTIGERAWYQPPDAIRSLWHYTSKAFEFHSGLTNSAGNHHPWESKPWTWPMSLRPVLYAIDQQNVPGCGAQSCVKAVMMVGTPAMWWVAVPVLGIAVWRAVVRRDWRYTVVLVGYCAGFLPWFADIDRQMYFFYAVAMAPFMVMAIALICGDILYQPAQGPERRTLGVLVVCGYVALVITNFAWLFPVLTGMPISQATWNMEIWLPSWRCRPRPGPWVLVLCGLLRRDCHQGRAISEIRRYPPPWWRFGFSTQTGSVVLGWQARRSRSSLGDPRLRRLTTETATRVLRQFRDPPLSTAMVALSVLARKLGLLSWGWQARRSRSSLGDPLPRLRRDRQPGRAIQRSAVMHLHGGALVLARKLGLLSWAGRHAALAVTWVTPACAPTTYTARRVAQSRDPLLSTAMAALWSAARKLCQSGRPA